MVIRSTFHPFRTAYKRKVMDVHAPRLARRSSYGEGPDPPPPTSTGSSARIWNGPDVISCVKPDSLTTVTSVELPLPVRTVMINLQVEICRVQEEKASRNRTLSVVHGQRRIS